MKQIERVLHVFGALNHGGAETMIMNIYRNIDRSKVQFDFIIHTSRECDYSKEIIKLGGKIYSVPQYTGKNHFEYIKIWREFFEEHKQYKIVHGHVRSTGTIYLSLAKKYGLITISHSHSTSSGKGIASIVKNILQYPIRYVADYFIACSLPAGEWLFGKQKCQQSNFFILKNAIEVGKFEFNRSSREKIRKQLEIQDKFVIGHIGRFVYAKNHDFIIDVFKNICDLDEHVVLLLIGEGELKENIEEKVDKLGLQNKVFFMGSRADTHDLVQAMDVFILPSLYEGLGIAAIEAQAAGLRCIVSKEIPSEVKITPLIDSLPIDNTAQIWTQNILSLRKPYERLNMSEEIASKGYDINQTAEWIQNFYITQILEEQR